MLNYFAKRLLLGIFTLVMITLFVYGLIRAMPGSPLSLEMDEDPSRKISQEDIDRMHAAYGLDKPWYVGYRDWLMRLLHGDLDVSIRQHEKVTTMIGQRVGPTLLLSGASLVLTFALAVPMGLFMTSRSGRFDERALSTLLYMLYSFPTFVAALLLQIAFAVKLNWLPLGQMVGDDYDSLSEWGRTWDVFKHSILPIACETYGALAYYSRFVHTNLQEVMRQDYIRTARAKGLPRLRVLAHHALRNTMIPLVTLLGLSLPSLLSGAVILEQIFNWPGMGRLFFEVIRTRDYPVIMGLVLMFSSMTLLGQLLADLLYAVVDPRITYS